MRANGFTLVELLVALTVMALLASAVVLTMPGDDAKARFEAVRFASRVAAARDQAIMDATPTGVWVAPSGYGFERLQRGRWEEWQARPLVQRDWARDVSPALGSVAAQRIRFDAIGLPAQAATVALRAGERTVEVGVSPTGEVTVR